MFIVQRSYVCTTSSNTLIVIQRFKMSEFWLLIFASLLFGAQCSGFQYNNSIRNKRAGDAEEFNDDLKNSKCFAFLKNLSMLVENVPMTFGFSKANFP